MLEQCPACSGQVSRAAAACPHCGHPMGETGDAMGGMIASPFVGLTISEGLGWLLFGVSLGWWFLARSEQWWQHG